MSHPSFRYSICTLNAWNDMDWDIRRPNLVHFVQTLFPDILAIQEARPNVIKAILEAGAGEYDHVVYQFADAGDKKGSKSSIDMDESFLDEKAKRDFKGWQEEGNIFWKKSLFQKQAYGTHDIGILEPHRRLFWVKLKPIAFDHDPEFIVSTAHFTWQGSVLDFDESDIDPRKRQARNTLSFLKTWIEEEKVPAIFCGDLNDGFQPRRIIRCALPQMQDCFSGLKLALEKTHPARPAHTEEDVCPDQVMDFIFYDQSWIKPILSTVPKMLYSGKLVNCSDHYPVCFMFQFLERRVSKKTQEEWKEGDTWFEAFNHIEREKKRLRK